MSIHDLAQQLQVSTATISRALNRPESVRPATRDRVLAAIAASGYQLNGIARSLRTQRTRTIGLIVSDIRNPFFSTIAKAVEDVTRAHQYTLRYLQPPLTAIAQPTEEMGRAAAELLLARLDASKPKVFRPITRIFPPVLIVRGSTSRATNQRGIVG